MIKTKQIDLLMESIEKGLNITDSCKLAGISREVYYTWLKEKKNFKDEVEKAQVRCKAENIKRIQSAGKKAWQACAWWLERKYAEEFGLKQRNEITGALKLEVNIPGMQRSDGKV